MAIEFALFGLGSEKGGSLLRAGASKAKVSITIGVDGGEYSIQRSLVRKKGGVQQLEGTLTTPDGAVMNYSSSELKEKVLEILNFNEPPNPKAQSFIFRYAVFTPQEEMKTILFLSSDLRLQTLRKAFRLEDYRIAAENARILVNEIERRIDRLEIKISEIPDLQKNINDLQQKIREKQKDLDVLNANREKIQAQIDDLNSQKETLQTEEKTLTRVIGAVEPLEKLIRSKGEQIEKAKADAGKFEKKLTSLQPKIKELEAIENSTDKTQEELEEEIEKLEKVGQVLRRKEAQIESKIEDYETIQESGVCPTCDRPVKPSEIAKKIKTKVLEKEEVSGKAEERAKKLEDVKDILKKKAKYEDAQEELKELKEEMNEYAGEISGLGNSISGAQGEIDEAKQRLVNAQKDLTRLQEVSKELKYLEVQTSEKDRELRSMEKEISAIDASIKGWNDQIESLQQKIKEMQGFEETSGVLKENRIWLEDYFIPTLDQIERQVLLNINQDFNANFQKWFGMLVEDPGKEARVDEEFTPVIQQDGYEQEIYYLSGGEKTSAALAYRLALNALVQRVSTGMRSNLLILDEPTDGFSKEQLVKVREVLDEIQSPQVIIVSHERELESLADQVFRVSKVQGESKITLGYN